MKRRIANNKNIQNMKQKDIDIYEILKNEEYGTELYTPKCGSVWHSGMANDKDSAKAIWTEDGAGREHFFDKNGKIYKEGEILLFPSKQMRDWSKFFKKGDVLEYVGDKKLQGTCTFEKYEDETKTRFFGRFVKEKEVLNPNLSANFRTVDWVKKHNPTGYIRFVEERLGGKLNRKTLEIEKAQPDFKDGDILFVKCKGSAFIEIFNYFKNNGDLYDHASLDTTTHELDISGEYKIFKENIIEIRLATEEEKKQFFSALEKEGKAFDAEKKQIVGLKPAFEVGKLYVFHERDEDGELTIIGKLIDKNESEDTLTFGNQYEIENEKFVTDQTFDLRISTHKELREATEGEAITFQEACTLWEKEKEHPVFKPFDKVLVRCNKKFMWMPAFFVRDRGDKFTCRYKVLPLHSGHTEDFSSCIPFEGHENIAFTAYDIENLPF